MSALCQKRRFILAHAGRIRLGVIGFHAGRIRLGVIGFWVVRAVGVAVPKTTLHLRILTIP